MNEEILSKIRKLRALAASADEHEAAAAAAAAQALMSKHRIEEAVLEVTREAAPTEEAIGTSREPLFEGTSRVRWNGVLASGIANVNGCRVYWTGGTLKIVGTQTNVTTCRYLYGWLSSEVSRLASERGKGKGRAWAHAFRLGCAQEISRRLTHAALDARDAARRAATAEPGAIVRFDQALERLKEEEWRVADWMRRNLNLNGTLAASRFSSIDGYASGRASGQSLSLTTRSLSPRKGRGRLR